MDALKIEYHMTFPDGREAVYSLQFNPETQLCVRRSVTWAKA